MSITSTHKEKPFADIIAALASGAKGAAIGVIRISGKGCMELCSNIIKPINSQDKPPQMLYLSNIIDPVSKDIIDKCLVCNFYCPHSYTGEDYIEIHCHGSSYIINKILSLLYDHGARPAEPGEFTKRAYINGKLDLSAAEGIKLLIESKSRQQWLAANKLISGSLLTYINAIKKSLIKALSYLEIKIDFPDEEDSSNLNLDYCLKEIKKAIFSINKLIDSYDSGKIASNGYTVVITGFPNSGKSTLMNTLLGESRAIVTPEAGTTRDYIEQSCMIDGVLINLIDTAGLRDNPSSEIEKIGIQKTWEKLNEADLILCLFAADMDNKNFNDFINTIKDKEKIIKIISKSDINNINDNNFLSISCYKNIGIDKLKKNIIEKAQEYINSIKTQTFITTPRHLNALKTSKKSLEEFLELFNSKKQEEILALSLQDALYHLKSIIGEVSSDEILSSIFSDFCIGK